jgi:WD40 repeat protein
MFRNYIPDWISQQPEVESGWNAVLQTLEGHSHWVYSVAFSHDSRLLASASGDKTVHDSRLLVSASGDKTVRIWDAATGTLQQTITVDSYVCTLSFDVTNSILITNIGRIKVNRTKGHSLSISSQEVDGKSDRDGLGINGSWVTWNAQNLLWLPPDFRATTSDISPTGSTIAVGCVSGRVFVIGISLGILCT